MKFKFIGTRKRGPDTTIPQETSVTTDENNPQKSSTYTSPTSVTASLHCINSLLHKKHRHSENEEEPLYLPDGTSNTNHKISKKENRTSKSQIYDS